MFGKVVIMTAQEGFSYCLKQLAKHSAAIAFAIGASFTAAILTGIDASHVKDLEKRITELENAQKASPEA